MNIWDNYIEQPQGEYVYVVFTQGNILKAFKSREDSEAYRVWHNRNSFDGCKIKEIVLE